MKKEFDFYEFAGVVLPGLVTIFGVSVLFTEIRSFVWDKELSVGDFGITILLSYVAGQVIQALGNAIESGWWKIFGGMPSDWVRTRKHFLLADEQIDQVEQRLSNVLGLNVMKPIKELKKQEWYSITRQIYTAVQRAGAAGRVDIFNGNYGLNRGVAAALLFLLALCLMYFGTTIWQIEIWLVIASGVGLYRMHRFGRNYARELFVQFIQLQMRT